MSESKFKEMLSKYKEKCDECFRPIFEKYSFFNIGLLNGNIPEIDHRFKNSFLIAFKDGSKFLGSRYKHKEGEEIFYFELMHISPTDVEIEEEMNAQMIISYIYNHRNLPEDIKEAINKISQ